VIRKNKILNSHPPTAGEYSAVRHPLFVYDCSLPTQNEWEFQEQFADWLAPKSNFQASSFTLNSGY